MRPVQNVFQKLSCTEQRREGVVAYLCRVLLKLGNNDMTQLQYCTADVNLTDSNMINLKNEEAELIFRLLLYTFEP
jgi:hypothetical protein